MTLAATLALWIVNRPLGEKAVTGTLASLKEMLFVLPPIFIILGLLDVWVPREKMVKFLGEGSGIRGTLIAFVLGSAAAGPLYGAFPVAQVLLKKGASMRNVLVLLGAWSTTKIPMLMFEYANLGARFTLHPPRDGSRRHRGHRVADGPAARDAGSGGDQGEG